MVAKQKTKIKLLIYTKTITLLVLLGLFLMPFSMLFSELNVAHGADSKLDSLFQEKNKISNEIKSKREQVKTKKNEVKTLNSNLQSIENNINTTEEKISSLQTQIEETQNNIEETENQITEKQVQLNEEKEKRNETICLMYERLGQNTLELLIGADNLSEAIDKIQYFETLETKIKNTIDEVSRLKKELEEKKNNLGNKKTELASMKSEQEAYKQGLDNQKYEKKIVLANVNAQKNKLEEQIEEAKKLSSQVEAQIAQVQAQMRKSSNRTVMARDRGTSAVGYSWPVNYNYLSSYYGERTPFQAFHTGLDMVNIPGTPVYASAGGTVLAVTDMMYNGHYYGYGKYIIVGHNARYSSLYAHLMASNVSVGDEVNAGDVIGYLGNTGWSTGPHLHFEIWDYGQRQNPLGFLP